FKGTEANPDYFYVGGSLLSDAAIGDYPDPTGAPMLADLAGPKNNAPYYEHTGLTDLSAVAGMVDTRHNSGAVLAFLDGHVNYLTKAAINGYTFVPSISKTSQELVLVGEILSNKLYDTQREQTSGWSYLAQASAACSADLRPYNLTRAIGREGSTIQTSSDAAGAPSSNRRTYLASWLDSTATIPDAEVTTTSSALTCYGAGFWGLSGDMGTSNAKTYTLVPKAGQTGTRLIGILAGATSSGKNMTARLKTIQFGSAPAIDLTGYTSASTVVSKVTKNVYSTQSANAFLIPVGQGTVKITLELTGSETLALATILTEP
ncbi:MAG TPA: hypothetical protein VGM23_05630, partial [Armatimonadota bacterium]